MQERYQKSFRGYHRVITTAPCCQVSKANVATERIIGVTFYSQNRRSSDRRYIIADLSFKDECYSIQRTAVVQMERT